jgi:hypothetical protein
METTAQPEGDMKEQRDFASRKNPQIKKPRSLAIQDFFHFVSQFFHIQWLQKYLYRLFKLFLRSATL